MKPVTLRKKNVGRPRRTTLEQVIEAACKVGPDMAKVAEHLGIGLATLYTYVQGRDHLINLVAGAMTGRCVTRDRGQSWDEAVREHADRMYQVYREWPQLIVQHVHGLVGDPTESEIAESLFRLLLDRGLLPEDAVMLAAEVMHIVIGGAAIAAGYEQLCADSGGKDELEARILQNSVDRGFSSLYACMQARRLDEMAGTYRNAVERAIAAQMEKMRAGAETPRAVADN